MGHRKQLLINFWVTNLSKCHDWPPFPALDTDEWRRHRQIENYVKHEAKIGQITAPNMTWHYITWGHHMYFCLSSFQDILLFIQSSALKRLAVIRSFIFLPSSQLSLSSALLSSSLLPRGEGGRKGWDEPECQRSTVQMLFHLIHQSQHFPSVEGKDAATDESFMIDTLNTMSVFPLTIIHLVTLQLCFKCDDNQLLLKCHLKVSSSQRWELRK